MTENAHTLICREGRVPSFFTAEIRASWKRCYDMGLDPLGEPRQTRISDLELNGLREKNALVRHLAKIEMENLHRQIAGSKFVIIFADADGIILDRIVDGGQSGYNTDRIGPGYIWREETNGTNALGLVAARHIPSIVHGEEHYFKTYTGLTCAASPILGRNDEMVGIIDATSNSQSRQHHTLALVRMSCITIENGLFRDRHKENLIIEMHNRLEFLGTLQSASLAFDEQGFLLEPSRQAKIFLQGITLTPGIHFEEIFRATFHDFLDHARQARSVHLVDREGSAFAARAFPFQGRKRVVAAPVKSVNAAALEVGMLHNDPQVREVMHLVKRAVELNVPILIRGETGTGKELMARYAHIISGRKGDFVAINCAALPEFLIESELFGHTGGAFTGASHKGAKGLVQKAHQGTLFLDEIGTMPARLQAKLLRFLDRMEIRPIGETVEMKLDIQLISATNAQLPNTEPIDEFRSDLLYRINTMEVGLPPLRRRADFQAITEALLKSFNQDFHLEPDALQLLEEYSWPGNIRELKAVMTRLYITCENGRVTAEDIRKILPETSLGNGGGRSVKSLADQERELILEAYHRNKGNISAVSRELNISRNKVYKKLKESWSRSPNKHGPH
ncbi:MAG: sigma-54-dependent Fis family transcriptional regulator [Thermodesulfobacteriota bacterium]